jgi:hypothetical protein
MTTEVIDFLYKDFPARLSAVESDGQWYPLVSLYSWDDLKQSTRPFPTKHAALDNAREYIIHEADRQEWKQQFIDTWTELVMGDADWEWETPEQDWASIEWAKREGRTGAEHAQMLFDEDPEIHAKYRPGGSRYEEKKKQENQ